MRLAICHTTHYDFGQPIERALQRLRLQPKSSHGQHIVEWEMQLDGARCEAEYEDHHHNRTALISLLPGARAVTITCTGLVDTADNAGITGPHVGNMPLWHFRNQTRLTEPGPMMLSLIDRMAARPNHPLERLHELSREVLSAMRYEIGSTDADTLAEAALAAGHGVCQDHAHVFIGCARLLGVPARYVSGYLMMNDRIDQEAGHGWAEAHIPDLGWVAFDVSNGISADARYVRVATGCDYREAAPVTGISYGAGQTELAVRLAVEQKASEQ